MSFSTCLKFGATVGFVGGLFSSACFAGAAERNKNNQSKAATYMTYSFASLSSGSIIGTGVGGTYYGLNKSVQYLRTAPRSTKIAVTIIGSAMASGAYTIAKNNK